MFASLPFTLSKPHLPEKSALPGSCRGAWDRVPGGLEKSVPVQGRCCRPSEAELWFWAAETGAGSSSQLGLFLYLSFLFPKWPVSKRYPQNLEHPPLHLWPGARGVQQSQDTMSISGQTQLNQHLRGNLLPPTCSGLIP